MAILWTGYADAVFGCFNGKYTYNFWRPWAAIPAGGANSELLADPTWKPLVTTPNHPEYPAAHGCVTGAVTNLVADYFLAEFHFNHSLQDGMELQRQVAHQLVGNHLRVEGERDRHYFK